MNLNTKQHSPHPHATLRLQYQANPLCIRGESFSRPSLRLLPFSFSSMTPIPSLSWSSAVTLRRRARILALPFRCRAQTRTAETLRRAILGPSSAAPPSRTPPQRCPPYSYRVGPELHKGEEEETTAGNCCGLIPISQHVHPNVNQYSSIVEFCLAISCPNNSFGITAHFQS
jgi:hypothetical protein